MNFTIPSTLYFNHRCKSYSNADAKATPKQSIFQEAKGILPTANAHTTRIHQ
jgi:hypothetical protein